MALTDAPEKVVLAERLSSESAYLISRGLLRVRTEPWTITDKDGYKQTAMVEVETPVNGGDRVMVSYPLLAKMLTDLSYTLPSDYDI